MSTDPFTKQILRQHALNYWIQSGNRHLPLRYAWKLDGAKGVGWVLRARASRWTRKARSGSA